MRVALPCLLALGCAGPSGPPTTNTSSASIPSLDRRVQFLERYVAFRRTYRELDFKVVYHNNASGWGPGPSDWDVRIVAVVPPEEVSSWVPEGVTPVPAAEVGWLADAPGAERAAGIREWYAESRKVVGIDRSKSVVAFRVWTE